MDNKWVKLSPAKITITSKPSEKPPEEKPENIIKYVAIAGGAAAAIAGAVYIAKKHKPSGEK